MKNTFFLVLLITICSCEDDPVPIIEEYVDGPIYLPEVFACESDTSVYNSDPFRTPNHVIDRNYKYQIGEYPCISNSANCQSIEIADTFYLSDNARKYLPQSGLNIGEKIFYESQSGEVYFFSIMNKDHSIVKTYYNMGCSEHYCFNSEKYVLDLFSQDCKYELTINVTANIRGDQSDWIRHDGIGIRDYNYFSGIKGVFYLALSVPASQENILHPNFEIFGKEFKNVHTLSSNNGHIKIYYNTKYGIVGFIDDNNKWWKLIVE